MCEILIDDLSAHKNFIIDEIYKIYEVENVLSYSNENYNSWKLTTEPSVSIDHYYFVIDTLYDEAFSHWVFESAIYLPVFHKLKKLYPSLKLVLKAKRTFKQLFCKYFQIEDVVYDTKPNNICLFPSPITSLNDKNITEDYKQQVYNFAKYFDGEAELHHEFVIMPRQSKENFIYNDRKFNFERLINCLKNRSYILNTDEIVDLNDQIAIVKSGKNICVTEGSPFYVNGLFCNNKTIYIVDISECCITQPKIYIKLQFILDTHKSRNKVVYISQTDLIESYSHF
jgi:hypothetical protein